ncbi:MAG TPA: hypothetical protein VIL48_18875 [Acidimicrobiales bacterium]
MQLTALGLIVATLVLAALDLQCSSPAGEETVELGDEVPDYTSLITAPGEVEVLTEASDPAGLRAVFDDVRSKRTEGHTWSVTILCALDRGAETAEGGSVLATGRFANTQHGLALTGLADTDDVEFSTTGRACAPSDAAAVPGAVTPEQVIATVEAAGLAAPNPRDASNFCAEIGCVERTTTDAFTVAVWPDRAAAARWADAFPLEVVRVGPVTTVEFTEGARTFPFRDDATTDAYIAALEPLR